MCGGEGILGNILPRRFYCQKWKNGRLFRLFVVTFYAFIIFKELNTFNIYINWSHFLLTRFMKISLKYLICPRIYVLKNIYFFLLNFIFLFIKWKMVWKKYKRIYTVDLKYIHLKIFYYCYVFMFRSYINAWASDWVS